MLADEALGLEVLDLGFVVGVGACRDNVVLLIGVEDFVEHVWLLFDKVLVCWCTSQVSHGEVGLTGFDSLVAAVHFCPCLLEDEWP